MDIMEGQYSVSFVELRVWGGGTIYHSLVVTKHRNLVADGDTKIPEGALKVNDLLNACMGSHKLRAICGSLKSCLFLGVQINWGLVEQMKDVSH